MPAAPPVVVEIQKILADHRRPVEVDRHGRRGLGEGLFLQMGQQKARQISPEFGALQRGAPGAALHREGMQKAVFGADVDHRRARLVFCRQHAVTDPDRG